MFKQLWNHLSKRRQKQFYLLLVLMIIASIAEVISIGLVIPFLGILTSPSQVYQHQLMQPFNALFSVTSPDQLILPVVLIFIVAILIAGVIRLLLLYTVTRLSFVTGTDLSTSIYRRTLYQEYSVHIDRNSSEIINGIIIKTNTVISGIINPVLNLISSIIIVIVILSTLFIIDTSVALTASIGFGLLYFGVIRYTRKNLKENSKIIAKQSTQMIKALQEGLGGIRDVLIDGSQGFYCSLYRNADMPLRRARGDNVFIGQSPRYAMEAIGMVLIAIIAYIVSFREDGLVAAVPILGAFALGAQKLLPALQIVYASYSNIAGSKSSFKDALNLLNQPIPRYLIEEEGGNEINTHILFKKEISLNNIGFRYQSHNAKNTPWILKNINLQIKKGERIGFIGATGSGKSTIIDIIMGLLSPTSGEMKVDGKRILKENVKSWQANIAHVPQNIYLSDSSVEENIAFGIEKNKINHQLVKKAAKQAQISQLIEGWSEGYQSYVGERGVRLSGGQRQRIGIARALYKNANVLIFDEATSALDNKTEQEVMNSIGELSQDLTILIIAHRMTTLKECDKIVELDKNHLMKIKKYQNISYE